MKHCINSIVLAFVFCSMVGCQENFDKRLAREAHEYTEKHCPEEAEPGTRLDSLAYNEQSHVYSMYFTLNPENEMVFHTLAPEDIRYQLLLRVLNDEQTKTIKQHGVAFRFVYRSKQSGGVVYEATLTKEEYSAK